MILRGGGCAATKQAPEKNRGKNKLDIDAIKGEPKLAKNIDDHAQIIIKNAKLAESQEEKLMMSFQFFLDNRMEFWKICGNPNQVNGLYQVIYSNMLPLLNALEQLIPGFPYYSVQLSQIISSLSWILCAYFVNIAKDENNNPSVRYLKEEEQNQLLEKVSRIEELVDKEKEIQKYQNNLQYEIFIFKSIFTIIPTNSKEGLEILGLLVSGAAASFVSFKLDPDLLESLKRGVIYLYNEHEKSTCKRILQIISSLMNFKVSAIQEIQKLNKENNRNKLEYLSDMISLYEDVVSKSSDWQVQCAWIQTVSQIFQHKLIVSYQEIEKVIESKSIYVHKLQNQNCWLNIDSKAIEKDPKIKILYDTLENLQELGRFQYLILNGYLNMPGFEQLYFSKLTSQMEKQNYNLFDFNLNTISMMLYQAEKFQTSLNKIQQQIRLLSLNNLSKLSEIENEIQTAIDCNIFLFESIQGLNEYEQKLLVFKSKVSLIEKDKDKVQDQIQDEVWYQEDVRLQKKFCKEFIQFFTKTTQLMQSDKSVNAVFDCQKEFYVPQFTITLKPPELASNSNQASPQFPPQANKQQQQQDIIMETNKLQQQLDQINEQNDEFKPNIQKILELILKRKTTPKKEKQQKLEVLLKEFIKTPYSTMNLSYLQQKLKYVKIQKSKHIRQKAEDFLNGFDQAVKFIKQVQSFMKWNLRILVFLKYNIKDIMTTQYNSATLEGNITIIQLASKQLSNQKSVIRAIKYLYRMYQACDKMNIIRQKLGEKNVIYNVLHSITIRKFKTQNILMEIYREILQKICEQESLFISTQLFEQIEDDIEQFISELQQLKRAASMVTQLIQQRQLQKNFDDEEFKILTNKVEFKNRIKSTEINEKQLDYRQAYLELQQYSFKFNKAFKQLQSKQKNSVSKELQEKQAKISDILEKMEILLGFQSVSASDEQILNALITNIASDYEVIENLEQPIVQHNIQLSELYEDTIFKLILQEFLSQAEHDLIINLDNIRYFNRQQGTLQQLIKNTLLLEQNQQIRFQFQEVIKSNKANIKQLVQEYYQILPTQFIDCDALSISLKQAKIEYSSNLQSEIYFILTQIGKKEDITTDPGYYDQFKEVANDFITKNKWRIRQFCIYELINFKRSCLTQETAAQSDALFIKYKIYETDSRNQLLLNDQTEEELNKMISKCWQNQEEDIQTKIKEKLEELNDIAYKITIETNQYEKSKLKKNYMQLEREIQGIIKNAEGLGNSLGTSVLFFQDLKRDLVNVQAQLTNLQGSIDVISKDITYLKGRTVKDLLIMRMQRVLQQRLIINSESVYIPIKTRERFVIEGFEDDETPLLTDDLFGDGEINEFIWKQQKLSFLIHGKAGSGKSTAARKIEEFLWQLYKKNMNVPESIPIIPIFISLPSLKDPQNLAMEETLKSDNYRFSEKQVIEFLEAVENNEFKLVIIMDSYDELNSQYIGCNLNQSNKLNKWKSNTDEFRFPKIITTSRSEIFTNNDYRTWFLFVSENLQYYKEVQLQNFNQNQVTQFIEQHSILSVKKIIKEFYFNKKENQGFFAFEELFESILEIINQNQKQNQSSFLLSKEAIDKILEICDILEQDDIGIKMQLQLSEIWSVSNFKKLIQDMDIDGLLETPFMIQIVTEVLPQMIKQRQDLYNLKDQFIKRYQSFEEQTNKTALQTWQLVINNDEFIKKFSQCFKETDMLDSIQTSFNELKLLNNFQYERLKESLRMDPLCSYDFYLQFFSQYFKKQIQKLRDAGEQINYVQNDSELWEFTHRLANEMTLNNLTQVQFLQKGLIFKKKKEDWKDTFFNDDCEQGPVKIQFRRVMPLRQKFGIFSFQHKSLQEFLVAKWIIQFLDRYENFANLDLIRGDTELDLDHEILLNVSFCQDFMKGTVKFLVDKIKYDYLMQKKLEEIVILSKSGSLKPSMLQSLKKTDDTNKQIEPTHRQSALIRKNSKVNNNNQDELIIRGSSNSLFLLHLMKFRFTNLEKIRIKDIDLIGANFCGANLSQSQFTGVNLSKSNFNSSILDEIIWENIYIDELPSITCENKGEPCIFYYDALNQIIIYKNKQSEISFFDYKVQKARESRDYEQSYKPISNLINIIWAENYNRIILIYDDYSIVIRDLNEDINDEKDKIKQPQDIKFKLHNKVINGQNKEQDLKLDFDQKNLCLLINDNKLSLVFGNQSGNYMIQIDTQISKDQTEQKIMYSDFLFSRPSSLIQSFSNNQVIVLQQNNILIYNIVTKKTSKIINSEVQEINQYYSLEKNQRKFLLAYSFSYTLNQNSIIKVYDKENQLYILETNEQDLLEKEKYSKEGYEIILDDLKEQIQVFRFVEDGKYLLSLSIVNNKTIMRLWNYKEKKLISSNLIDSQRAYPPLILPNSLIATTTQKGVIQIWDLSVCYLQQNEKIYITITSVILVDIESNIFAVSGNDKGVIQVWDTNKGVQIGQDIKHHRKAITCLSSYSEADNSQRLISCDQGGYLFIWNLIKQEIISKHFLNTPIESIAVIKQYNKFVTLSKNTHYIQIWNRDFKKYKFLLKERSIDFEFNDPLSMFSECQKQVQSNQPKIALQKNCQITCLCYCPLSELVYVASLDKAICTVSIYEEENEGKLTPRYTHQIQQVDKIVVIKEISEKKVLLIGEYNVLIIDQKKIIHNIKFNEEKNENKILIKDALVNQDLLMICTDYQFKIINLLTNKQVIEEQIYEKDYKLQKLEFNRKFNVLYIGTSTGKLIQYDLLTRKLNYPTRQHSDSIINIILLEFKNYLITCGKDKKIFIWSIPQQNNEQLTLFREHDWQFQIDQIWYDEIDQYFFFSNQSQNQNEKELHCMVWKFWEKEDQVKDYYCFIDKINNNDLVSFVYKRKQMYLAKFEKKYKISKQYLLQEKLKQQNLNQKEKVNDKEEFCPDMMLLCSGLIITADVKGKIYSWDCEGSRIDVNLQLGFNEECNIERFVFDYSEDLKKLVFFYLQKNEKIENIIKIYKVGEKSIEEEDSFEIQDKDKISDVNFAGSIINSVSILTSDLLLITFNNLEYESQILSIQEKQIIYKIGDHFGQLRGSAAMKGKFVTYGPYNQISYYQFFSDNPDEKDEISFEKIEHSNGHFSEKFRLGDSIQKFSCKNVKSQNQKGVEKQDDVQKQVVQSKHGINLINLFTQRSC